MSSKQPNPKYTPMQFNSWSAANFLTTVFFTSATVTFAQQPFQALLTGMQTGNKVPFSLIGFRTLWRGILPNLVAGQQRGALAVSSKQVKPGEEAPPAYRWAATMGFSQADLFVSQFPGNLAKLQQAQIVKSVRYSMSNIYNLMRVNWGARSGAGLVNFAFIGFMGDECSRLYSFNSHTLNSMLGGMTGGFLATVLTTPFNAYSERKLLRSTVQGQNIVPVSALSMFRSMGQQASSMGYKEAFRALTKLWGKEVMMRGPSTMLTFAIIHAMGDILGPEPLARFYSNDSSSSDSSSGLKR